MSSQQQQEEQQQFRIPATIEGHKLEILKWKALSTVLGIDLCEFQLKHLGLWIIVFATFLVLKFVPGVPYGAAIGVCSGICFLSSLIYRLTSHDQSLNPLTSTFYKLLISSIFGWLWSHQLHYSSHQPSLLILSFISIATSIGPICIKPLQQFASSTLYISQPNIHSTLYIRLLLPLPIFIIELILDYGEFLSPETNHLFYIRLSVSLVFLVWVFGWVSTIYNMLYFFVNNVNKFLFGDQTKHSLSIALLAVILNCVPIAIYYRFAEDQYRPLWILLIGSTITAIVSYCITLIIFRVMNNTQINNNNNNNSKDNNNTKDNNNNNTNNNINPFSSNFRIYLSIILQLMICGSLLAILLTCDFTSSSQSIKIITIINTCIYCFFQFIKLIAQPRNSLGLSINITPLNSQYMRCIQRAFLRASSGLVVIILVQNLSLSQLWTKLHYTLNFSVDLKFVQYFFLPFIVYRSFKRTLSESTSFSLHLSILIALGSIYQGYQLEAILVVLFFPPFPPNFIMTLIAPFTTPKKLSHHTQLPYQLVYLIVTLFSWIIFVLSIGMLEFSMIFGLPAFWCMIPNISQGNRVKSKEHSLYQKIVDYIPKQLFRYQSQGFYLLRISKYILLVQIKSTNYGFGQTLDIKGLQVQEVTSCHSKEGETIDKLVEQTWGDNRQFFNINTLWTVLSPLAKSVINVPTQNQIQLTGIIESKQFVQLFKKVTLKALIYQVSKLRYTQKQLTQGEEIISDIQPICRQQKFISLFPLQFAKQLNFQIEYPFISNDIKNIQIKKKMPLPPIKNKNAMVNDFMDLLDTSQKIEQQNVQTSTNYLTSQKKQQQNLPEKQQTSQHNLTPKNSLVIPKINIKHLNASLIMTLYHFSVGKFDYLNIRKLIDLIKMQKGEMTQVKFEGSQEIVSRALSMGMKIAMDKMTMGEEDVGVVDFEDYERDSYLGIAGTQGYNEAVSRDLSDIWSLNYSKGKLSVKRLSKSQNELYLFGADSTIIKSVWNNLRFELMYATNDNDQRYSIQTHPYLMRNLWTEACEEPFGYPSYHSGYIFSN